MSIPDGSAVAGSATFAYWPELPPDFRAADWSTSAPGLSPGRLAAAEHDARWDTRYAGVRSAAGRPLAFMAVYRSTADQRLYHEYDLPQVVPGLAGRLPGDLRRLLFLGGRQDLVAGVPVAPALSPRDATAIRGGLVARVFGDARRRGLHAVALYLRGEEVPAFRAAAGPGSAVAIAQAATLPVTGRSEEQYALSLSKAQRKDIRRDHRRRAAFGLEVREAPAGELVGLAAPLVLNVKARHGVPDHARLIELRLRRLIAGEPDRYVGFVVRDAEGRVLAVELCYRDGDRLEAYELGLVDESPARHAAYLEAMVYAPLRYAQRRSLTRIELGLDAPEPKRNRGAVLSPVWAVVDRAGPRPGAVMQSQEA